MSWEDRIVEYPNRVVLTPVQGMENTYDMTYAEGEVEQEGTLLNAANMEAETNELIETALSGDITPANIKAGTFNFKGKRTAGSNYSTTIKFDTPFSKVPKVVATVHTAVPNNRKTGVTAITTSGFTLNVHTTTTVTDGIQVDWIAIGI